MGLSESDLRSVSMQPEPVTVLVPPPPDGSGAYLRDLPKGSGRQEPAIDPRKREREGEKND